MAEQQRTETDSSLELGALPERRHACHDIVVDCRRALDVAGLAEQVDGGGAADDGDEAVTLPPSPQRRQQLERLRFPPARRHLKAGRCE
jgi:hypothetical protein